MLVADGTKRVELILTWWAMNRYLLGLIVMAAVNEAPAQGIKPRFAPPVHPFANQGVKVYPTPEEFLAVANQLRTAQGLAAVEVDPKLTAMAQSYAETCMKAGFNSHYHGGRPEDRLKQGFNGYAEEILAGGPPMLDRDPFAAWKFSSPHYAKILGKFSYCGFGVAYDQNGYGYWVGIYGIPSNMLL